MPQAQDKKPNDMPADVFQELAKLCFDNSEVQLVFGARDENASPFPDFRRLDSGKKLTAALLTNVKKKLRRLELAFDKDEVELRPYNEDHDLERNTWEFRRLGDHPHLSSQISRIIDAYSTTPLEQGKTRPEVDNFSPKDREYLGNIEFYGICLRRPPDVGDNGHPLVIALRKYNRVKAIKRSVFAIAYDKNHYDTTEDPLFVFDAEVDVLCYKDFLFINKRSGFRRIFDYENLVEELANKALTIIEDLNIIENFDQWKAMSLQFPTMKSKLAGLSSEEYLGGLTIDRIVSASNRSQVTVAVNDKNQLRFDPGVKEMAERWSILKLLCDSFLESPLTGRIYEAGSKTVHT